LLALFSLLDSFLPSVIFFAADAFAILSLLMMFSLRIIVFYYIFDGYFTLFRLILYFMAFILIYISYIFLSSAGLYIALSSSNSLILSSAYIFISPLSSPTAFARLATPDFIHGLSISLGLL
jgi:hypothetical protein